MTDGYYLEPAGNLTFWHTPQGEQYVPRINPTTYAIQNLREEQKVYAETDIREKLLEAYWKDDLDSATVDWLFYETFQEQIQSLEVEER